MLNGMRILLLTILTLYGSRMLRVMVMISGLQDKCPMLQPILKLIQ